jgi:hypothetical protein
MGRRLSDLARITTGQQVKERLGGDLDLAAEPQHWGWPLAVVHEPVGGGAAESEQCGSPDEVEHGRQRRIVGAGRGGGCHVVGSLIGEGLVLLLCPE